ncbi:serine/threonine-protein kinase [Streptomyces sp. NPDC051561]|uniref:serine/threonine-protein kinase n=1 Tax=Streptomyces sp. NPDC051561 TaxID=3365658 RepID=UPI00379C9E3E
MESLRPRQDPASIGTYTLLARLGAGGMGQVYLGRSPGGRLVAIKVIRDEITDHPEALSRFRREANTVRAVRSAYTANLMDASLEAAPYWIATEYVSGPTLAQAVRERGAFPAATARGLCAALAEGLASVHAYDVTHRDLKPMNVILAAQGPQLIDFGIARGVGDTALTVTGMAPGTPGFTAPEVLIRNQVGPEADVFALGATVAYAVTGRPPFGSGPTDAVSYRAVHEPIDLAGVLDPGLVELVRACVAKAPEDRPTPEEVIRRCGVRTALVDDLVYGAVVGGLGESVPEAPDVLHELPTGGPGLGYIATEGGPVAPQPRRRRPWVVAVAVGAVVGAAMAATYVLLPEKGGEGGSSSGTGGAPRPTGQQTRAGTPRPAKDAGLAAEPPTHIENNKISRDYWVKDMSRCNLASEERAPGADFQMAASKDKVEFRIKYAQAGFGQRPAPYYVSVAVKPPHEIDSSTGKPYEDLVMENKQIGYSSRPVDVYKNWETGDFITLKYPEDFQSHFKGKSTPAIPVANDPGDWTVVFHHVKSGPEDYVSIACSGFAVDGGQN